MCCAPEGSSFPLDPPHALYQIDCVVSPDLKELQGTVAISLRNTSTLTLRRLVLNSSSAGCVPRDATVSGNPVALAAAQSVSALSIPSTPDPRFLYLVDLAEPLTPGGTVEVRLAFSTRLDGDR